MLRQRHEATLAAPMTKVFSALVQMLARSRWASDERLAGAGRLPRVGQTYVQRRGSVIRRGRVVECLRPVVLTLYESLFDPPCRVRLRLRWRRGLRTARIGFTVSTAARRSAATASR